MGSNTNFGRDYGGATPTGAATAAKQTGASSTATHANVASSATVVTLQALNTSRLGWSVFNDSTAVLYVKCGSAASATSYTVQVAAGGYWECPFWYQGVITGLWASVNGNARVVEYT